MRTPGTARLIALLLALGGAGCGPGMGDAPPPITAVPEAERYQKLQAAAEASDPAALYRSAMEDPNEFLRAMALKALAARGGRSTEPPPGFQVELMRAVKEDPDVNQRYAVILLLRHQGAQALEEAARVCRETKNPETAHEVAVAAGDVLPEALLVEHWRDERAAVRGFVHEVVRLRTRRRDGLPIEPAGR